MVREIGDMNDIISIVIPTKNNGDILEKCLFSIQNLECPEDRLEVIIVDGHSADDTVGIAKKYGCKVIFEDEGRISYAREIGVRQAKGKFIAFTDADCVVDRDWIKELIKHFKDDVAAVGGPNITPEDDSAFAKCVGVILSFLSKPGARYGFCEEEVREIYHNPTCNVMYRKSVLEEVGGFNHSLVTVDDEELDYRIRENYLCWALSILIIGGIGIGAMSLYLGSKTGMRDFLRYYALIAIWFWGWGLGFIRGVFKPVKEVGV